MKGRERVFSALAPGGTVPDQRPFTLTLSLYGARLAGIDLKDYYQDPLAYAAGQRAVADTIDPDIVFSPFKLTAVSEAFGGSVRMYEQMPPNMTRPGFVSAGDLCEYDFDRAFSHPALRYVFDATERVAADQAAQRSIAAIFLSPVDLPALIMGIGSWLETILFDPDHARIIMDKSAAFVLKAVSMFREAGADFTALPVVFCNPRILTKQIIAVTILPLLRDYLCASALPLVIHHGGAPILEFIDSIKDLPNVAAVHIDASDSFAKVRDITGADLPLLGNLDGPTLNLLSAQSATARCKAIMNRTKNDAHFIFASSGADIPYDTPLETITAVTECVRAHNLCGDDR